MARMGAAAIATTATEVLGTADPKTAGKLDAADDTMERLHQELFSEIPTDDWAHGTTAAVDLTSWGRYYDRFPNHAVEVGRRTTFIATGAYPQLRDAGWTVSLAAGGLLLRPARLHHDNSGTELSGALFRLPPATTRWLAAPIPRRLVQVPHRTGGGGLVRCGVRRWRTTPSQAVHLAGSPVHRHR